MKLLNYLWFAAGSLFGLCLILCAMVLSSPSPKHTLLHMALRDAPLSIGAEAVAIAEAEDDVIVPQAAPEPVLPREETVTVEVARGDTLIDLLVSRKVPHKQAIAAIDAMRKVHSPRKIKIGQSLELDLYYDNDEVELRGLAMQPNLLETVTVRRQGDKFVAGKEALATATQLARAGGTITSSFYQAGEDAGLDANVILELIKAYSYDVDFQRDIKPGQRLDVLFEQRVTEEGIPLKQEAMKYAAFSLNGKKIEIYRYTDPSGHTDYYYPNGESIRKALIKTPINGARISSGYGVRRHPVLGYSKMHKGIDFAAPTGTPVYAAGDGVVQKAQRWGSYGNYVKISHNGTYATAYAHLHRFAKGIRPGKRVKQGDVIAYVGTTGRSTGPHLHYEILKAGHQVNPRGVKFKTGRTLAGKELAAFKKQTQDWQNQFAALPRIKTQVALAE